jgi:hypothetical protein
MYQGAKTCLLPGVTQPTDSNAAALNPCGAVKSIDLVTTANTVVGSASLWRTKGEKAETSRVCICCVLTQLMNMVC